MSVNKAKVSPFVKQCLVAAAVSINNLAHGSGLGYPAVLLPQLRQGSSRMRLDAEAESWVASITAVALIAGNLLTIPSMRRGRKLTHQLVSLLHIAGWIAISLAPSYEVLMLGRFLTGASNGLLLPIIGVIIGEYSSPAHRGVFISTASLSQALGVFFVHLVGSFLPWEDTALLLAFFPLTSFAITVFTPESPSWLAVEGRYEECKKAFRWMRGNDEEEELEKMIQARQHFDRTKSKGGILETIRAFSKRELYIPLALGILVYTLLVGCGSTHYASYMDEILRVMVNPVGTMPAWMAMCNGVRLVSNVTAVYVVARLPRRMLLFITGVWCTLAYFAQAVYVYAKTAGFIEESSWLPAILLISHISPIGLGLIALAYIICGEVFPLQFRGTCCCISNLICSIFLFLLLKTFPAMCASIGLGGAYVVYGVIMGLTLMLCWFLLPETRGRTLQEIEEHFRGKPMVPEDLEAREVLNGAEKVLLRTPSGGIS